MAFRRQFFDLLAPIPASQVHDRWISFLLATRGRFAVISDRLMQYRQHRDQQLGPGPRTLWERTRRAKLTKPSFYFDEIERLCEFRERLKEYGTVSSNVERALEEIGRKISHLEHRGGLSRIRVARIPGVLRQTFIGYYWRYSMGWSSIAKDLLVP
jgi:hypothetical protein